MLGIILRRLPQLVACFAAEYDLLIASDFAYCSAIDYRKIYTEVLASNVGYFNFHSGMWFQQKLMLQQTVASRYKKALTLLNR